MQPRPDHGEDSYQGSGRLNGRKVLITALLQIVGGDKLIIPFADGAAHEPIQRPAFSA